MPRSMPIENGHTIPSKILTTATQTFTFLIVFADLTPAPSMVTLMLNYEIEKKPLILKGSSLGFAIIVSAGRVFDFETGRNRCIWELFPFHLRRRLLLHCYSNVNVHALWPPVV